MSKIAVCIPLDTGIVEEVFLSDEQRQNDFSYKFYGISDEGRTFLKDHGLLRAEETLQTIYERGEKSDAIERYQTAPRPDY